MNASSKRFGGFLARGGVEQLRAHQRVGEGVFPGAGQRGDLGVERARIGLGPRLVDVADHEQDARQLAFAQLRLEALDHAAIGARDGLRRRARAVRN